MIMKKLISGAVVISLLFLSSAYTGTYNQFEISKNLEIFSNVYKELNTWYVDELDPNQLMRTGIDAMLASLDPYTNYFSESQIESYRYQTEGRYDGVGASIEIIDDLPTIVQPLEDSPAMQAGLRAGDQIIEVNGSPTRGRTADEVDQIVRGVPGTELKLKVRHPGTDTVEDITLIRGEVQVPNVPYAGYVSDGVGYIALTTFTREAGRNVANALRDLKTENPDIRGIILDLRNNGGGLLREAVNVCNVFLPKNEMIVSTRGKVLERDNSYETTQEPVDTQIPVVILINENSASASEIVSGAIQDMDRGVLLGQRSYGKGLVQNTRDVGYNARIKMTTSKYYIPSGRCIQSVEYANGEPKHISDDQRAEFKTRKGRPVLDGGGIKPDVEIAKADPAELIEELQKQHLIFKYVTGYCLNRESIPPIEQFSFEAYDEFLQFLKKQNFAYTSKAEMSIQTLKEELETMDASSEAQAQLKKLESDILEDKAKQYTIHKDKLIDLIEQEIAGRYYFQEGTTKQRLKKDPELQEAIELLNSSRRYKEILS